MKIAAATLVLALSFVLAGCGDSKSSGDGAKPAGTGTAAAGTATAAAGTAAPAGTGGW